jgi:DNA-directed RNA polymerase specialized sigma24 family protein
VKRRVAERDVEDIVQTVLVEALASERTPDNETELKRWLIGVARHKIADLHRRGGREQPSELPDIEAAPPPIEERQLAQWAEDQAKSTREGEATLRWMAREGEGDKLEHIAEEERVPAARVRQRVSRMRRFMKERWLAELAAVAALGIAILLIWRFVLQPKPVEIADPTPEPIPTVKEPTPIERAMEIRKIAMQSCDRLPGDPADAQACLEGLDRAAELDPEGDKAPEVQAAREKAKPRPEAPSKSQNDGLDGSSTATPTTSAAPTFPTPTKAPAPKPQPKSFEEEKLQKMKGSDAKDFTEPATAPPPAETFIPPQQPSPQVLPPPSKSDFQGKGGKPQGKGAK